MDCSMTTLENSLLGDINWHVNRNQTTAVRLSLWDHCMRGETPRAQKSSQWVLQKVAVSSNTYENLSNGGCKMWWKVHGCKTQWSIVSRLDFGEDLFLAQIRTTDCSPASWQEQFCFYLLSSSIGSGHADWSWHPWCHCIVGLQWIVWCKPWQTTYLVQDTSLVAPKGTCLIAFMLRHSGHLSHRCDSYKVWHAECKHCVSPECPTPHWAQPLTYRYHLIPDPRTRQSNSKLLLAAWAAAKRSLGNEQVHLSWHLPAMGPLEVMDLTWMWFSQTDPM